MKDLHELPKLRDSVSFLYIEHAIIEQQDSAIVMIQESGQVPVPVSAVTCLMIGPGTTMTHAAIRALADNGCMVVWCGERGAKFYAAGQGETRSAKNILIQAQYCMDEKLHMQVVRKMYEIRFPKIKCDGLTLQQIRGIEGVRMRKAYQQAAKQNGITWKARKYKNTNWDDSDDINKALSEANAILYSICQAAIISLGYSTALGFIHTGKALSFVYDIADLYKADMTIPAAFEAVKKYPNDYSTQIRRICRGYFHRQGLMKRIAGDLSSLFHEEGNEQIEALSTGNLWDEDGNEIDGDKNYGSGE